MADAQRQLVLRTFANSNGDAARAAKQLGMDAADVRRQIMTMLNAPDSESDEGGVVAAGGLPMLEENGRLARRTPAASAPSAESKAKPAKKK